MDKKDELQYMPMMHGRIQYTDEEFKETNIKNHGVKKGTVRWNAKKIVYSLVIGGAALALVAGPIHGFDMLKGSPTSTIVAVGEDRLKGDSIFEKMDENGNYIPGEITDDYTIQPDDNIVVTEYISPERYVTDYKIQSGDTLDGIIYGYTSGATEEKYYKDYVTLYNNIDGDVIRMGDVITLVGVPEDKKEDFDTGRDKTFDANDQMSIGLNNEVQDLLNDYGTDYAKGSLMDSIVKELEVFNATTNKKARNNLANMLIAQIESVRKYGNVDSYDRNESDQQIIDEAINSGRSR